MPLADILSQIGFDICPKDYLQQNEAKRRAIARSFISDTVTGEEDRALLNVFPNIQTAPTKEMLEYAIHASLGDDVFGDDTATTALETHMAKLTGKEAALFVPSGTASNQIAVRTHLHQPPYSVLCDHRAHVHMYEGGGIASHSGATTLPVIPSNGHHLTLADIEANVILDADIHYAPTQLICLENTLNGTIFPQVDIIAISQYAHSRGIKVHLDGARLWHVAAETATPIKELCDPFDSVSLCFSKGLGAPLGSCLVGSSDFIKKARWFRKQFGGGMRQTGFLAAAAAFALTHNVCQLPRVHALARRLEAGLEALGVEITSRAETCMVFYDARSVGVTYDEIDQCARALPEPITVYGSRLVVHIQTSDAAIDDLLGVVKELVSEKKREGFTIKLGQPSTGGQYKSKL